MRQKHDALVEALHGQFDEHPAELAQILLGQIDALDIEINRLTTRTNQLIAGIPEMQAPSAALRTARTPVTNPTPPPKRTAAPRDPRQPWPVRSRSI
jgi:hypothetical protein